LIDLKIIEEFSDAVFVGVDVESLLVEAEVLSLQTRRPFRKGHNFSSNRWITLKIIEELPDAVFLGVDVESLLVEEEVLFQTTVPVRKGRNI